MLLVQRCAAVPHVEVAHLALDATWIESAPAADAASVRDLGQQGVVPASQTLRGERPQLAASCA